MISKIFVIIFKDIFALKDLYNVNALIDLGCTNENKEGNNE